MTTAVLVVCILLLLLAVGWLVAIRVKRRLESAGVAEGVLGVSRHLQVPRACVEGITRLTLEPILLRRDEIRVSVQIGEQPLKAIETVPDKAIRAAIRDAAVAMDVQFGPKWTALVQAASQTSLLVTRLA